ncbi:5'-3' DNA helicase ZGRF1 [Melanerpes formicivorus]|uniref:5'-3' DNA helicase ZGRF1 n=1 Tax=Melanerpes formicivorus TaxID=211600 RepID=UPI00358E869B
MESQEFTVLYTHQKMKKSKTWQDGVLRIRAGRNKAVLFDDKGQCLESIFISSQLNAGDSLESERYLITVEALKMNEKPLEDQPRRAEIPAVDRNGVKPAVLPPRHLPVGLKRKFTGFQVPRQVEKKMSPMEDGESPATFPLPKQCQGTLPSTFYISSPLFSTICKKDEDATLPASFHEDVCMANGREHRSLPSLLSAPFLDRCVEVEKQNPGQSIVKPEFPPVAGHTQTSGQTADHRAVSHKIRSTAQIIALLKSKPAQRCREQPTSQVSECLPRLQASEEADILYDHKSTTPPAFTGDPAKRLPQKSQPLPFTKGTANGKKEWNAEMLSNSAEQPWDKEFTGQRHEQKAKNFSQELQDPCSASSFFPPESTMTVTTSDSQFVPSSGDVSWSSSPTTFEADLSRYREHSVTGGLQEDSSVKLQSGLQSGQNSAAVPDDLELSVDRTVTGMGVVKEEFSAHDKDCGAGEELMEVSFNLVESFDFNDSDNQDSCEREVAKLSEGDRLSQHPDCLKGEDVVQNPVLGLHSCSQVVTHSENEAKCSTLGGENDGNYCTADKPSQLCDSNIREGGRTAEDSANQTRTEGELLGDGHNVKERDASQLRIEATNSKRDFDGCAAHTTNGMSWVKSKHSEPLPGDTNVNESHPKACMLETRESISCVPTSRVISAMARMTKEDVTQLGCVKSSGADLGHLGGSESDAIKPDSPLLALSQRSDPGCDSLRCFPEDHQKVIVISDEEEPLTPRGSIYPLGQGHSSPEETAIGETEFGNAESTNAFQEACKGDRRGMDYLKCTVMAENSSELPDLVNNIALIRALTEHSTALESLQKMEDSSSTVPEAETSKEIFEPLVKDEAVEQFTDMPYSECVEASSCSYFDSPGLLPNCMDNLLEKTDECILPVAAAQRDPGTLDCQPMPVAFQGRKVKGSAASEVMLRAPCSQPGWQQYPDNPEFAAETFLSPLFSSNSVFSDFRQSPSSRSLHEDDTSFSRKETFQKSNIIEEPGLEQSPLALNMCSEAPPWAVSGSPACSDWREKQWTSWQPDKIIPSAELTSSLDPYSTISSASGTTGDIQEPLTHGILPSDPELSEMYFTQEKPSYPEECNLSRVKPMVKTRSPFVTLPATEMIPDAVYPADKEVQQSFGSSAAHLGKESVVFPINAFGLKDRNYETSVFGEYTEDGQRESAQPVFPNMTPQHRQSKWLKYQNNAQCDLITQNSDDKEVTDDICAENVLGMLLGDTGESSTAKNSALQMAKSMPGKCCPKASNQDFISERKSLSLHLNQTPLAEATQKVLSHLSCQSVTGDSQAITIPELSFPPGDKVKHTSLPKRQISIPTVFQSHIHYKQIFKAALTEQLNILLFESSQRLHNALSKVDISFYISPKEGQSESKESCVPLCNHKQPAKLVMVKKEGQNKGRLFYACDAPKAEQCSFFKWIEDVNPTQMKSRPAAVLQDIKSIGTYLRSQQISLYEGCQLLVRKAFETQSQRYSKFKKFMNTPELEDSKPKLYLKLSRKEHSSLYSKDDIWVISKTLLFDPLDTFIASTAFFGPSSNNEMELLPLKGYSPSNWRSNTCVHALLVCNASGELTSLRNMEEHFNPSSLPLIPYLLKKDFGSENATKRVNKRKFIPPAFSLKHTMKSVPVSTEEAMELATNMIQMFSLNPDQAASLIQIAQMMTSCENSSSGEEHQTLPVTIIRGVFGAGKSYLLSVVILFLVQLFERSEATEGPRPTPWKLLIASSTNVAVDRILLGLLDLGFEDFIRVGSIRKITKAILPHSLHAGSGNDSEQLKELLAVLKEDLTPAEKIYVKKSIEQHKLGTNKAILQQVKVVGVTCAACPFPCLNTLKFPVVMLDECSQMTEPASLLPIARFQCEKLVLVGDPKQLPPTIPGSESVHEKGLEQTLFDRLCLMGHKPVLLRRQYRCHPAISAIANELFYGGELIDGVSEKERRPLLHWLPTLCFYSVNGVEQMERDNSFYNMAEVHFTVKLIQSLIASGIQGSAVGVITLYKSQMCKIQTLLHGAHSEAFEMKAVQVSTVDAFQGAEKEVIILSCVRSRQMGFIDSERRMNVALTRAKRHLLILGHLACLSKNRLWGRVIHHCKGWENGLQHVSQCEQQLNNILKCYLERWKEEQSKKKEK